jgi:phage baseplate assembly protein W
VFYGDLEDVREEITIPDMVGKGLSEFGMINGLGQLVTNTGKDRVVQSIRNILETPLGTRFFLPSFGSRLNEVIFEPNDYILKDLVALYIRQALETWEKRIEIKEIAIDVDSDPNICYVRLLFKIKGVSAVQSLDYSFNRSVS